MKAERKTIGISFNSPVILGFVGLSFLALLLDRWTAKETTRMLFSVYASSPFNPLTYLRLFGHVLGHAGWEHFFANIVLILVIGPLLEEKYGSKNLLFVILSTALITGILHILIFPNTLLLGASGVLFTLILLSSFTCVSGGNIPLTFLLVACIYIGEEVYRGLFTKDNISNLTHIAGGVIGSGLGYVMNKNKMSRYHRK